MGFPQQSSTSNPRQQEATGVLSDKINVSVVTPGRLKLVRTNLQQDRGYKYIEPVRKKSEREALRSTDCRQCKKFYDAVLAKDANGVVESRCKHHDASRHRYKFAPPATPEGFWNIGFDSDLWDWKGFGTLLLILTPEIVWSIHPDIFSFWSQPQALCYKLRKALCYKDSSFLWRGELGYEYLGVETGVSRPLRAKAFHHCHHLPASWIWLWEPKHFSMEIIIFSPAQLVGYICCENVLHSWILWVQSWDISGVDKILQELLPCFGDIILHFSAGPLLDLSELQRPIFFPPLSIVLASHCLERHPPLHLLYFCWKIPLGWCSKATFLIHRKLMQHLQRPNMNNIIARLAKLFLSGSSLDP